jgi:N-acetylglucosaminyl-diphospho-decaprenol L-rhamnosyltransferase
VVVLTYRSAGTLEPCLAALDPQVRALDGELVVVDNASPDDTVAVAERLGVRLVQTGANLGFAAGCNVGADATVGDPVVFVNPDAIVDDGALEALASAARDRAIGPLGGRGHHGDGTYDRRSVLGRPSLGGALLFASGLSSLRRGSRRLDPEHGPLEIPADGQLRPVAAVSGAFLAVPRPLWDALGGFDERFFLYGEDVDLCMRSTALGRRPTVVSAAGYRHLGRASSGSAASAGVLLHRGKVELYRRYLSPVPFRIAVAALQLGCLLRAAPSAFPIGATVRRAAPWRELFKRRRRWRRGYLEHVPGTVPR